MGDPALTGWYIAYIITGAVIALVVVLVAAILEYARRIGRQAMEITEALDDTRVQTMPLWDVSAVTKGLNQATEALARIRLQGGGRHGATRSIGLL